MTIVYYKFKKRKKKFALVGWVGKITNENGY